MKYCMLLTILFFNISGDVQAKALDKIIDILVGDLRTREMFKEADTRRKRDSILPSLPKDVMDTNSFDFPEKMKRQIPLQLAATWWSDMDNIAKNPPNGLPWKDDKITRNDIHIFPRHVSSFLRYGNIKSNKLGRKHNNQFSNNLFPESPPKEYFQLPSSMPLEGFDSIQEGPPAGLPWKKDIEWARGEVIGKRNEVIRRLNAILELILSQEKRSISPESKSFFPLRLSKRGKSFTIDEKKDSISQLKGGKNIKKWHDRNRITLYKRLIGDLNDLISLEVKKNEGNETFEVDGVSVHLPGLIPTE